MLKTFVRASGLVLALFSGAAGAATFDCAVDAGPTQANVITNRYILSFDADSPKGEVMDATTQYFLGKAAVAKVVYKEGVKVAFIWSIKSTSETGQHTNMQYRAAVYLADNSIAVSATPPGYSNSFSARGTCVQKR